MHVHLTEENTADALASTYRELGVDRAVLQALPPKREPGNNDAVLQAARDYPDLLVPFFGFDLDDMEPDQLDAAKKAGFAGVKFIGPCRPYNHPEYFPVYERAEALGLPALFHLGIVANKGAWRECDSGLMRPIHLDHIARTHPDLTIIGAHLGNPWYDEATMSCRWNPNLYFDLSGSTLKKKSPEFLGTLLWWTNTTAYGSPDGTCAWEKIVFGSDVHWSAIKDVMHDYEMLMEELNLAPHLRRRVWGETAAELLGL
jgi:hypothetical protein